MALIHPTDRSSVSERETTKHPGVCLAGGFAFIVGSALIVHLIFSVLL